MKKGREAKMRPEESDEESERKRQEESEVTFVRLANERECLKV